MQGHYVVTQSPCGRRYGVSRIDPDKFGPVVVEPPTMTYPEAFATWEKLLAKAPRRNLTGEHTREAIAKRREATVARVRARFAALQTKYPGTFLIYERVAGQNPQRAECCVLAGGLADDMAVTIGVKKKTHNRTTWSGVEYYAVQPDRFADVARWAAAKDKSVAVVSPGGSTRLIPVEPVPDKAADAA